MEKWIHICYDYVLKYCKTCMIQGHIKDQYYVKHPKLYKDKQDKVEKKTKEEDKVENTGKTQVEEGNSGDEGFIGPR